MSRALGPIGSFVAAFSAATGLPAPAEAFAFGDESTQADGLARSVLAGRKRATAALLVDAGGRPEDLPSPGETAIVLDGSGRPVCVIRTIQVDVVPFREVDADFAYDEGEGDRTLRSWVAEHERFFRGRCEALGLVFRADLEVVLERFETIWHPGG